jgi:hypothetical protein
MSDQPYTKREIDLQNKSVIQKIDGLQNVIELRITTFEKDTRESLSRIEIQTTKTNGQVIGLRQWQAYVIGFCACLSLLVFSVVIPIVASYIQSGKL